MDAQRQLLLGLLALPNGIINQGQLVAAFGAWTLEKSKSLAQPRCLPHLSALDPLRSRADFPMLMMDIAMLGKPFAQAN